MSAFDPKRTLPPSSAPQSERQTSTAFPPYAHDAAGLVASDADEEVKRLLVNLGGRVSVPAQPAVEILCRDVQCQGKARLASHGSSGA